MTTLPTNSIPTPVNCIDYVHLEELTGRPASGMRRSMTAFVSFLVDDLLPNQPKQCFDFLIALLQLVMQRGLFHFATKQHAGDMARIAKMFPEFARDEAQIRRHDHEQQDRNAHRGGQRPKGAD